MGSTLWITPEQLGDQSGSEFAWEACKTASYLLWAMSGRKFSGITSVTEVYRYIPETIPLEKIFEVPTRGALTYDLITHPYQPLTTVVLRGRPVLSVSTVRTSLDSMIVGGTSNSDQLTVMPADSYFLTDHSVVNFKEPHYNQDIEISYTYGSPPPVAGQMAARVLAQEFAMAWSGDEGCSLPSRVTTVARQGVTYTILDQQDFIADLRTGLYPVDLFLKSVNPSGALRKARVFSPDIKRGRRYTPKALPLTVSAHDMAIPVSGSASVTLNLAAIGGSFLTSGGWTPEIIVNSYASQWTNVLTSGAVISEDNTTITLTISYSDAVTALGAVDPGFYDLYGVLNGVSTYITSGNLSVKLI